MLVEEKWEKYLATQLSVFSAHGAIRTSAPDSGSLLPHTEARPSALTFKNSFLTYSWGLAKNGPRLEGMEQVQGHSPIQRLSSGAGAVFLLSAKKKCPKGRPSIFLLFAFRTRPRPTLRGRTCPPSLSPHRGWLPAPAGCRAARRHRSLHPPPGPGTRRGPRTGRATPRTRAR